jgi:hypothetical protein
MLDGGAQHLQKSKFWLIDGTFWVAPKGWFQLFTIMGFDGNSFVPCAHFLLSCKHTEMYTIAFRELFNELWALGIHGLAVEFVITDFEWAERNAFTQAWSDLPERMRQDLFGRTTFPVRFIGCLFHFAQAVYREYRDRFRKGNSEQKMGLKVTALLLWLPYFLDEPIRRLLRLLIDTCTQRGIFPQCVAFLTQYFIPTWVGEKSFDWWRVLPGDTIVANSAIE